MTEHEREMLASIEVKLDDLIEWKNAVSELLYGNLKGEFGYFHKSNILWRLIILWPVLIMSIIFGSVLTFVVQHLIGK